MQRSWFYSAPAHSWSARSLSTPSLSSTSTLPELFGIRLARISTEPSPEVFGRPLWDLTFHSDGIILVFFWQAFEGGAAARVDKMCVLVRTRVFWDIEFYFVR